MQTHPYLLGIFLFINTNILLAGHHDTSEVSVSISYGYIVPKFMNQPIEKSGMILNQVTIQNRIGRYCAFQIRSGPIGFAMEFQGLSRQFQYEAVNPPYWYSTKIEKHSINVFSSHLQVNYSALNETDFKVYACLGVMRSRIGDYVTRTAVKDTAYPFRTRQEPDYKSVYYSGGIQTEVNLLKHFLYLHSQVVYISQWHFQNGSNEMRRIAFNIGLQLSLSKIFRSMKEDAFKIVI